MNDEVAISKPGGLIKFMLYTDTNRRRAAQLGPDVWVDFEMVFGDHYTLGKQVSLCFLDLGPDPVTYVVAMLPLIRTVQHPGRPERTVPMRTVYLATEVLWPFFEPVTEENLTIAIMP